MNDSMRMQVLQSIYNLSNPTLNFQFMEPFSASQKLVKGLIMTQLKKNVHVLIILKEVLKPHYMHMMQ